MRPLLALACLAAMLATSSQPAHANSYSLVWGSPKPTGAPLRGMAFEDDQRGWAVGDVGTVLRTTDGGASWQDASRFPAVATNFTDVLALGSGVLLATGPSPGLYRSPDGGEHWVLVPHPGSANLNRLRRFANGMIVAVGDSASILCSTDGGATWGSVSGPEGAPLSDTWWLDANTGFVVGPTLARRTTDGGVTWSSIEGTSFAPWNSVQFTDAQNGVAFADFYFGKTTNGGATWTWSFITGGPVYVDRVVLYDTQHWLISTGLEGALFFETLDGGQSWTFLQSFGADAVTALGRLPGGALVAVTDGPDALRSSDGGHTWLDAIARPGGRRIFLAAAAMRGSVALAGGQDAELNGVSRLLRSADRGRTWARVTPDPAPQVIALAWASPQVALLGGANDAVLRSTDAGLTWTTRPLTLGGLPAGQVVLRFSVVDASTVFASTVGPAGSGAVFRSTDGGLTWQRRDSGIPTGLRRGLSFADAQVGWAGDGSGDNTFLWRTLDGGASWQALPTTGLIGPITALHAVNSQTCVAAMTGTRGVWRTTDAGAHWTQVVPGSIPGLVFTDLMHGLAAGSVLTETSDGGATWTPVAVPLTAMSAVAADSGAFVVTSEQSRIVIGTVGVLEVPGAPRGPLPGGARLAVLGSGGPSVTFEFALAGESHATLDVFDVAGRRVWSATGVPLASGSGRYAWDPAAVAGHPPRDGVYYARVSGQHASASRRFVVLR